MFNERFRFALKAEHALLAPGAEHVENQCLDAARCEAIDNVNRPPFMHAAALRKDLLIVEPPKPGGVSVHFTKGMTGMKSRCVLKVD